MSRFDDSESRGRFVLSRTTSGSASRYRRIGAIALGFAALSAALGFDAGTVSPRAYSAEYGSIFSGPSNFSGASSAAAAASKSQYLQAQRQQAAQRQAQQAQMQAQQAQMAQMQAQQAQMAQMQAQQAQARQQAQQGESGSKRLFSGLFGGDPSQSSAQQQQQRQPLMQNIQNLNPFQKEEQRLPQAPERNNFLGFSPLLKRSKPQTHQQQQAQSQQRQSAPSYAQSPTQGVYAGAQSSAAQRVYSQPQHGSNYASAPSYSRPTPTAEALAQASSDRNEARDVLARIPWEQLSPKAREKVQQLTSSPSIYRRLPMAGGRCNPELFDYFLTHPNAVVELWRVMGYDDISMIAEGNGLYALREKSGSQGKVQILYQDPELTLVYCSGSYRGPALGRQLSGEVFLALQTRYTEDVDLTPLVVCRLDAFIDIKNPGVDLIARTFSSSIGRIADANFEQTMAFVDSVSQTIEAEPYEFQQIAFSLQGLTPEARRLLAVKAETVGKQAAARRAGNTVDYQLLPKMNSPYASSARILAREKKGYGSAAVAAAKRPVPQTGPNSLPTSLKTSADRDSYASSPLTTPGLKGTGSPARSGSISSRTSFDSSSALAHNEFSLADDGEDFESSIEWEEETELPFSSKGPSPSVVVPKSSLAKVGVKPTTKNDALEIMEEQENSAAFSHTTSRPTALSTDDELEFADDFSLSTEENGEEEYEAVDDEELTIAIPQLSSVEDSTEAAPLAALTDDEEVDSDAVEAAPLLADDDEESVDEIPTDANDAPLIILDFPEESGEPAEEGETIADADNADVENSDELLPLILPDEGTIEEETDPADPALELTDDALEANIGSVPSAAALETNDDEFDVVAEAAALNAGVEDLDEEEAPKPAAKNAKAPAAKAKPAAKTAAPETTGWTPITPEDNGEAPLPAPKKNAAKTTKPVKPADADQGNWTPIGEWTPVDSETPIASTVPSKFVTHRYVRPDASFESAPVAKDGEALKSEWRAPEKTASAAEPSSAKKTR